MFKIKTITITEGGGREQLLEKLASSLSGEKMTQGDYVVSIAKLPPDVGVSVRKKAVRKRNSKPSPPARRVAKRKTSKDRRAPSSGSRSEETDFEKAGAVQLDASVPLAPPR